MIIVDVETTGLDPRKHSLISIGALNFSEPQNQFYGEARPFEDAEITEKSLEINGFDREELRTKEGNMEELIKEFIGWVRKIDSKVLAGQNIRFDVSFLKETMNRVGEEWFFGHRFVDLHSYAYLTRLANNELREEGPSNLGLDSILNSMGLPDEPKPHDALRGAKYEAEAFSRLVLKEKLLEEFKQYPLPEEQKRRF